MIDKLRNIFRHNVCALMAVYYLVLLMVPNVLLCITEQYDALVSLVNIVMPLGLYLIILSFFRSIGKALLTMILFSALAAFQIVLLFLYGRSIIAVDMFLNVVTTNYSEATELLLNLGNAIVVVVIMYLPPLVWAVYDIVRRRRIEARIKKRFLQVGIAVLFSGIVLSVVANIVYPAYSETKDIFPINVISNIKVAYDRSVQAKHYYDTSSDFVYNSKSSHDENLKEVYVMVIGETSRAINWQLGGYERANNSRLSQQPRLTFFTKALSESNTTHKSVPMLMSPLTACNFDSINRVKSVLTAFKEAGFSTTFISNQAPNKSYIEFFGNEADRCVYMTDTLGCHRYDADMLKYVKCILADTTAHKKFIVLHSYGSHFKYLERYPRDFGTYKPDVCERVSVSTRLELINAYDNSIEYTDWYLSEMINMIERSGYVGAIVYSSDHGEDILDDSRKRFLHASPIPTYYQLHVAMLAWVSGSYNELYPDKYLALSRHRDSKVSSSTSLFNTLMDLAGIESRYRIDSLSLASDTYNRGEWRYLNDMNQGVRASECGLSEKDALMMSEADLL